MLSLQEFDSIRHVHLPINDMTKLKKKLRKLCQKNKSILQIGFQFAKIDEIDQKQGKESNE